MTPSVLYLNKHGSITLCLTSLVSVNTVMRFLTGRELIRAAEVFTMSLVLNGSGTMDFGFINSSKYIGNISYSPVTIIPGSGGGFWACNWTGFAIGNQKFN